MLLVGIDWADDHHDICLLVGSTDRADEGKVPVPERFQIAHTADGFNELSTRLRKRESVPGQILIAIETPHGLLVHELVRQGYVVYAIPPKSVNRYKDRHQSSSAKDDKRDALALAHLLRTDRERFRPLALLPDEYRLLDALSKDLRQLIEDRTRLLNRLKAALKDYYPQALDLFSELDGAIGLAFLKAYPEPASLSSLSEKQWRGFCTKQHYTCPKQIPHLYKKLVKAAPQADTVAVVSGKRHMLALREQLALLRKQIDEYEHRIQTLFGSMTAHQNLPSLPGVGPRLAPELAAILGPSPVNNLNKPAAPVETIETTDETAQEPDEQNVQPFAARFHSGNDLARLGGCSPVTRQSGKYRNVLYRRACDRGLRRTLRDWTQACIRRSVWARAYYDHARSKGRRHETTLRNLACKLLDILYKLWLTGEEYDEQRHIQQLKTHNVEWAMKL
jgi:transposase